MCNCTACNDKDAHYEDLKEKIAIMIRAGEILDLKHTLSINENGEFTVLFLSDVQFNTPDIDKKIYEIQWEKWDAELKSGTGRSAAFLGKDK